MRHQRRQFRDRCPSISAAVLAAALVVPTASAAPFVVRAADVTIAQDTVFPGQKVTLTYSLIGPAANVAGGYTNVKVELLKDSVIAKTITIPAGSPGATPGPNTVELPMEQLPEGGPYTVRVTPTGAAVTATDYLRVSNPNDPNTQFVGPRGVDVNRIAGHPAFGRIYVTEGTGGLTKNRVTRDGVYALNADLSPAFPGAKATSDDIGDLGPWTGSTHSPFRVYVAPTGNVYITDAADAHPMVIRADADLNTFAPLFDRTGLVQEALGLVRNANGDPVFGDTTSIWMESSGANRKYYLAIQEMPPNSSVWEYSVPEGATPAPQPSIAVETGYAFNEWYTDFVKDAQGNFYVTNLQNTAKPAQKFVDGWDVHVLPAADPATTYYGIAIDEARDTILLASNDGRIMKTNKAFNSVTPLITGLGKEVRDVAMDADGWVYAVSTTDQTLSVFAPPGSYTGAGVAGAAARTLSVVGAPLAGDIWPVGPTGLFLGQNGNRYGDGKVDLNDAIYSLRVSAGLATLP